MTARHEVSNTDARERVLPAGRLLFAEKGFDATTLNYVNSSVTKTRFSLRRWDFLSIPCMCCRQSCKDPAINSASELCG